MRLHACMLELLHEHCFNTIVVVSITEKKNNRNKYKKQLKVCRNDSTKKYTNKDSRDSREDASLHLFHRNCDTCK